MTQEAKVITSIIITTIFILFSGIFLLNKNSPQNINPNISPTPVDNKILIKEESYKIATPNAKVTIVEFSDLQCPACAAAHPIIQQILKDYQGRVNFVYRHFPLTSHKNSEIAAQAAEAAGKQGKFFPMQDILFQKQPEWSDLDNPLEKFAEYAKSLNLDVNQFKKDVENKSFSEKIRTDTYDGNLLGVNSTPTFFINGIKYPGVLSLDKFKNIINTDLRK